MYKHKQKHKHTQQNLVYSGYYVNVRFIWHFLFSFPNTFIPFHNTLTIDLYHQRNDTNLQYGDLCL